MLNTCSMPAFPLCQSGSSVKSCTVLSSLESPFSSSFIRFNLLDLVQMSHFVSTRCQFRLTEFRFPSPMSRVFSSAVCPFNLPVLESFEPARYDQLIDRDDWVSKRFSSKRSGIRINDEHFY